MITPAELVRLMAAKLRHRHRAMLVYHLFFVILAAIVLVPVTGWLMTLLLTRTGVPAISEDTLFSFIASPEGLLWMLAVGSVALGLVFLEHAGMIAIASAKGADRYRIAASALVQSGRRLPRLFALAAVQVGAHLVIAAPFVLILAVAYDRILGAYDFYFLVIELPPVLLYFAVLAVPVLLVMLLCNGILYLRWLLAVPAIMLEGANVGAALRHSRQLTKGWTLQLALISIAAAVLVALVPPLLVLVFDGLGGFFLGALPERFDILIPATVAFLALYIVFVFFGTLFSVGVNSLLIETLYEQASGRPPPPVRVAQARRRSAYAWGAEAALLLFALGQAAYVLSGFDFADEVLVVAHRGASMDAPENTLAAIEQAVADGADYVELDVRQTADGTPVLLHDRNLRRVAGVERDIWQVSDSELAEIEVGSWFDPRFASEPLPTLADAIRLVDGRAQLYLEIKAARQTPDLTANVMAALRDHDALDGTIVSAMDPAVLDKVLEMAPGTRTALVVHTKLGGPARWPFDVLAARAGIVTPGGVASAHRNSQELHVWTVNDPADMSRFIDMGVDAIITDRPATLAGLLEERRALTDAELLVIKIRNWIRS